ncbi:hypothetical protein BLA29_001738 [Euroglyphus maynei]|uniref:Uncharacterized protein n=1 Tax=Euroglyphus maynei TaxID=6958 RepID=A0A1Y3B612_EURMA|nr:hypothetical protein BLA29_001738 [Euroglyphus maynei]
MMNIMSSVLILFNMKRIIQCIREKILPTTLIIIGDEIDKLFECLKYYVFRLQYTADDYKQRQIPLSYRTFRRTIWITMNSWINIIGLIQIAIYPTGIQMKTMKYMEHKFHFQRVDLIISNLIITYLLLEYLWFILFADIIRYNFKANELVIKYNHYDDDQLEQKYRHYMSRFVHIGNLL